MRVEVKINDIKKIRKTLRNSQIRANDTMKDALKKKGMNVIGEGMWFKPYTVNKWNTTFKAIDKVSVYFKYGYSRASGIRFIRHYVQAGPWAEMLREG